MCKWHAQVRRTMCRLLIVPVLLMPLVASCAGKRSLPSSRMVLHVFPAVDGGSITVDFGVSGPIMDDPGSHILIRTARGPSAGSRRLVIQEDSVPDQEQSEVVFTACSVVSDANTVRITVKSLMAYRMTIEGELHVNVVDADGNMIRVPHDFPRGNDVITITRRDAASSVNDREQVDR